MNDISWDGVFESLLRSIGGWALLAIPYFVIREATIVYRREIGVERTDTLKGKITFWICLFIILPIAGYIFVKAFPTSSEYSDTANEDNQRVITILLSFLLSGTFGVSAGYFVKPKKLKRKKNK